MAKAKSKKSLFWACLLILAQFSVLSVEINLTYAETDPFFGYETKGGTETPYLWCAHIIRGSWFSCLESGKATSITIYLKQYETLTPKIKCGIYTKDSNFLIGYTEEWILTDGWDGWKTFNIVYFGYLVATDYWLVVWSDGGVYGYYDSPFPERDSYDIESYDSFPTYWEPTTPFYPKKYSIYCSYTPSEEEEFDCNYIGLNNTIVGKPTKFSSDWTDLNQSEGLSHYRFSTNNTGTWKNDTWTDSWENVVWAIATKTLNSTLNIIIAFRFYVNDTSGTEYASTICFFPTSNGNYGFALDFDGVDDYVEVQHDASLNFGTGDFTLEAWAKVDPTSEGDQIIFKGDTGWNTLYTLGVNPITNPFFYFAVYQQGVGTPEAHSTTLANGEWHHIVGIRNGTTIKIYVDGNLEDTTEGVTENPDTTNNLFIGIDALEVAPLNGTIDEVRIYNRILNQSEISYSYNNGNGRFTPLNQDGLVAWYHFDEGFGSDISDETENNNDGLLYGDTDEWVIGKIAKPFISKAQFFPYFGLGVIFALMIGLIFGLAIGYKKR